MYDWLSYGNQCGGTVHVQFVSIGPAEYRNMDLPAGRHSSTGYSAVR